jgi:hypothetical protein
MVGKTKVVNGENVGEIISKLDELREGTEDYTGKISGRAGKWRIEEFREGIKALVADRPEGFTVRNEVLYRLYYDGEVNGLSNKTMVYTPSMKIKEILENEGISYIKVHCSGVNKPLAEQRTHVKLQ